MLPVQTRDFYWKDEHQFWERQNGMHKRYGPLALGLGAGREGTQRVTSPAGVHTGYVRRGATIG